MILERERDWREIGRIQAEAEESEMFPEASSNINGTRAWRCSQTYQLVICFNAATLEILRFHLSDGDKPV